MLSCETLSVSFCEFPTVSILNAILNPCDEKIEEYLLLYKPCSITVINYVAQTIILHLLRVRKMHAGQCVA